MIGITLAISGLGIVVSMAAAARASKTVAGRCAGVGRSGIGCGAVLRLRPEQFGNLQSGWTVGGQPVHLQLDAVSALFLALLCLVGGAGSHLRARLLD